jgi:hypothetical protein
MHERGVLSVFSDDYALPSLRGNTVIARSVWYNVWAMWHVRLGRRNAGD